MEKLLGSRNLQHLNFYLINNIYKNKIKLYKNNAIAKIKINKHKIKSSQKDSIEFKNVVKEYVDTLNSKSKGFNSTLLEKNFKATNFDINVSIKDSKFIHDNKIKESKTLAGLCLWDKSSISYYAAFKSSYHELMHLASINRDSSTFASGFSMKINNSRYGVGINEAYTQYLTEKYFDVDKEYEIIVCLIEKLEIIVGENKLEKYYFNADFYSLYNELKKYSDTNEISQYIIDYDELLELENYSLKSEKYKIEQKGYIQKLINNISLFSLNALKNKILTFDKYNLTSENIKDIMYLLDKSNWVKIIDNKYNSLDEDTYESVAYEVQDYLSFEEAKKIS